MGHTSPCTLSVAILDEEGQVVERLCHRRSTRPMGLAGTTLYWDGKQRDGSPTPGGHVPCPGPDSLEGTDPFGGIGNF